MDWRPASPGTVDFFVALGGSVEDAFEGARHPSRHPADSAASALYEGHDTSGAAPAAANTQPGRTEPQTLTDAARTRHALGLSAAESAPHDRPDPALATYLAKREEEGRPITGQALSDLARATDTVNQVRTAFPFGSGNVASDLRDTGGQSYQREYLGEALTYAVLSRQQGEARGSMKEHRKSAYAAAAAYMQAGNCGAFADASALVHAATLRPGDRVRTVANPEASHMWAEAEHAASAHEGPIVMDAWAQDSAVFAADSRFAHDRSKLKLDVDRGPEDAAAMRQAAERVVSTLEAMGDSESLLQANMEKIKYSKTLEVWEKRPSVLSDRFSKSEDG